MASVPLKFVEPMKAAMTAPPPLNGLWLYEVKFDGYRVLAINLRVSTGMQDLANQKLAILD